MSGKIRGVLFAFALAFGLLGMFMAGGNMGPARVDAAISSEKILTAFSGAAGYTQTVTSTGQLTEYYNRGYIQSHIAVSGTGNVTITPQFSNEPGTCSTARYWYSPVERSTWVSPTGGNTGTQSLQTTETAVVMYHTAVAEFGTGDAMRAVEIPGRCVRFVAASSSDRFTPTLYFRVVNQ